MRSHTRERLRELIRTIEARPPGSPRVASRVASRRAEPAIADLAGAIAGASVRETELGSCIELRRAVPLADAVGTQPLADLRHATGAALELLAPHAGVRRATAEELLFLDIETTGLGGAGAMAFLVTTGRVVGEALDIRQYLAPSPASEAALLSALVADVRGGGGSVGVGGEPVLVTYNGRAFDAPFLDERAVLLRLRAGFGSLRHVDVLFPARTVYRHLPSRRLAAVEAHVLGRSRPGADVPGAEVPARYFRFLRTGDVRWLEPLLLHNELDVTGLAALTARLCSLLGGAREPEQAEAVGVARLLLRRGRDDAALRLLGRLLCGPNGHAGSGPNGLGALGPRGLAASCAESDALRPEALAMLARLHKRAGRAELALPLWEEAAEASWYGRLDCLVELAKHYEHRMGRFDLAAAVAERALGIASEAGSGEVHPEALRHRLARVHSRAARVGDGAA